MRSEIDLRRDSAQYRLAVTSQLAQQGPREEPSQFESFFLFVFDFPFDLHVFYLQKNKSPLT